MRFLKTNNKNWRKLCKGELKSKQLEINFKKNNTEIKNKGRQKIKDIDKVNFE